MNIPPTESSTANAGRRAPLINGVVRFYRIVLRVFLTIVFVLFVRSLFSQLPRPELSGLGAYILLKASLVVYMYCWFFGCNRDLSVQNDVLHNAPEPTVKEVALAIVFLTGFAFLFCVDNQAGLATVFLLFLAVNVGGWVYYRKLVRPFTDAALADSRSSHDVVAEVKTLLYQEYQFGRWQWYRFAVGFALLALLTAMALDALRLPGTAQDVGFACVTAITITVLEVWIWYRRLKLLMQWEGLDWLEERGFVVVPTLSIQATGGFSPNEGSGSSLKI